MDDQKKLIRVVNEITSQIKHLACPTDKKTCVGGMITKIEAAKIAMETGIPCVISNGRSKDMIKALVTDPGENGTLFIPKQAMAARHHWIAFGAKPKGKIFVDAGARLALLKNKSLLSLGIKALEGEFMAGDIVSIRTDKAEEFARGKTDISSKQLNNVKGNRFDKEIIHRDNIVIL